MRSIHFAILSACAVLLLASGCDSGSAVSGPGINPVEGDATGDADGTIGHPDTKTPPDGAGKPTDGGGGGGICGDGTCQAPFESAASCPQDCSSGPGKIMACVEKQCAARYAECLNDQACSEVVACAKNCSDGPCVEQCAVSGTGFNLVVERLMYCANLQKCLGEVQPPTCGNGQCDPGESPNSCPQDCKIGPGPVCGNGACEPGESPSNCKQDCGGGGPIECAAKKCPDQYAKCTSHPGCGQLVACMKDCDSDQCFEKCVANAGGGALNAFAPLASCAQQAGCGAGQPQCGNGQCEDGEGPESCPEDCAGPPPLCGDGICGDNENQFSCPEDCTIKPNPICGNGKCEPGENIYNCAKDCQYQPQPVCGNGKCEAGENPYNCPKDCENTPGPVCGNGKCEPGENPFTCPKDCDGPPPPNYCGDGKCTAPENQNTCPKDCGVVPGLVACVKSKCEKSYVQCVSSVDCEKIMDCAVGCSNVNCMLGCWQKGSQKGQQLFGPLAECAQSQGCLSGNPTPVCGNGQCEAGESPQSCPKDCGGVTNNLIQCGKKNCPAQLEKCLNEKGCSQAVQCMSSCTNNPCYEKCATLGMGPALQEFGQCAAQAGCIGGGPPPAVCGNGQCEPGETSDTCPKDCGGVSNGSCKDKCGKFNGEGSCQCDQQCQQYGDCCKDYEQYCGGPVPGPVCGDGICQPPVETSESCPADCGSSAKPCKSKSDCNEAQICCGMPDGQYCVAIGKCG